MDRINWLLYDGEFFQLFCNSLLSFEISKRFIPYSAPGRDKGIDGAFEGAYNGRNGKWRFQYKFHKTERKSAISNLKTDMKNELSKLDSENNFILLTNIELLPQERDEVLSVAERHLQSLSKTAFVDVWDGAKIHALYLQYPILKMWMEEGFGTAQLVEYKNYFSERLTNDITNVNTLNNTFAARDEDIKCLKDFVFDTRKKNVLIITGEGGVGKTRLLVEFLKTEVDSLDDWEAFVLNTHTIHFDRIKLALSGKKNKLVIIDDAHNFPSELINDMKKFAGNFGNTTTKLILTARSILLSETLRSLSTVEKENIQFVQLKKLTKEDTKQLFLKELGQNRHKDYIDQLTIISHGLPILIVALLRAISQNKIVPASKGDDFLRNYVLDYFDTVIRITANYAGISQLQVRNILYTLCLIEPVNIHDRELVAQLATSQEVAVPVVDFLFEQLIKERLLDGRYQSSISPDYYTDIFLHNTGPEIVIKAIEHFPQHVQNIIVNLVSVQESAESETQSESLLSSFLDRYIRGIADSDINQLKAILNTVSRISYLKPEAGSSAIKCLLDRATKVGSDLAEYFISNLNNRSGYGESMINTVASILHDLMYHPVKFEFVFDAIVKFYAIAPDLVLFKNTFGFTRRDYLEKYALSAQQFFLNRIKRLEPRSVVFVMETMRELLSLEFRVTSRDMLNRATINITTYYIPTTPIVSAFRMECIRLLSDCFDSTTEEAIKYRIVQALLDIPRSIYATSRTPSPYSGTAEVILVLEFFEQKSQVFTLKEKKEILNRLYWFEKWGLKDELSVKSKVVKDKLAAGNLTEEILYLLDEAEHRQEPDFAKAHIRVADHCRILLNSATAKQISEALSEILGASNNVPHFFWSLLKVVYEDMPDKVNEVYDNLWETDREVIFQFGSYFLRAIRFKHGDEFFFWRSIESLEKVGDYKSLNVILNVYVHLEGQPLQENDLELFQRVFLKHTPEISFNLGLALISFLDLNPNLVESLIIDFLRDCPQRAADHFFLFFFDRKSKQYYDLARRLVLSHTMRFQLSYEIQRSLNRVLLNEGFFPVFEYLTKRFDFKRSLINKENYYSYEFLPSRYEGDGILHGVDEQLKYEVYRRALIWYIQTDFSTMEQYFAKRMVEYFTPRKDFSTEVRNVYEELLVSADESSLLRIAETLSLYESKNVQMVDFVVELLRRSLSLNSAVDEFNDNMKSHLYIALTDVGVKSGSVGKPFQVDVDLFNMLKGAVSKYNSDFAIREFLQSVTKSLEKDIDRQTEKNDDLW